MGALLQLDVRSPQGAFGLEVKLTLEGRALAVLGPSGAGKTSLLEVLCGLRPKARGRIELDGEVLLDSERSLSVAPERRRVGYVPQDALLFPHLSVRGNIGYARRGAAADEAISLLELGPLLERRTATLSGGERQRVALARALASAPRLLLLDEPLAALDVELKERILPYLLRVRDELSVPMVYVTHQMGEALAVADLAVVLERGRVVALGAPGEVLKAPALLAREARYENVLEGTLEGGPARRLRLRAGGTLAVPVSADVQPGARRAFTVSADDVLIATGPVGQLSARNVLPGTVLGVEQVAAEEALARIESEGTTWIARLTLASARELELGAGKKVFLIVKTHSLRELGLEGLARG